MTTDPLTDRVVVVTGAPQGIGRACAPWSCYRGFTQTSFRSRD
jgi:NADP-dependent 3-hydroxy acid dehydrogenase YdfG